MRMIKRTTRLLLISLGCCSAARDFVPASDASWFSLVGNDADDKASVDETNKSGLGQFTSVATMGNKKGGTWFRWDDKSPVAGSNDSSFWSRLAELVLVWAATQKGSAVGKELMQQALQGKPVSFRRFLEEGKWDEFNRLFSNAELRLPNQRIDTTLIFALDLFIVQPYCKDIAVQDLILTTVPINARQLKVTIRLDGLDIICYSDYNYAYGGSIIGKTRGEGWVQMKTRGNWAEAELTFSTTAKSFEDSPPNTVVVDVLDTHFNIYKLDFGGNWVAGFLDTFEKLFREFVEDQLQKAAENEFDSLSTTFLQDIVQDTLELISDYLQPIPASLTDPLAAENAFVGSRSNLTGFLNFQDLSGNSLAQFIADLCSKADQMFGRFVPDPTSPFSSGTDLGINKFLRENMLDSERAITIRADDLPFELDTVLFSSHDVISESRVILDSVTISGLDTFKTFNPLVDIGMFTLQNRFHLDNLNVKLNLIVEIRPSNLEDAILRGADLSVVIYEDFSVSFGVDDLEIMFSVLTVIQKDQLSNIQIGSLLKQENVIACMASIIHDLKIAGLAVSIQNIVEPQLQGFVSPGIDELVTTAVDVVFRVYEPTFLKAATHIFQSTVRDILEKEILGVLYGFSSSSCDWQLSEEDSGVVDFRELFLKPSDAKARGATGKEPYGSLGKIAYGLMQDSMRERNALGALGGINDIVETFTRSQSGYPGFISMSDLLSFSYEDFGRRALNQELGSNLLAGIISSAGLSVRNVFLRNLNTIGLPLVLLDPTTHATTLANVINLGIEGWPYPAASARLRLVVQSQYPSPLEFDDEIEFTVSAASLGLVADAVVRLASSSFMGFPLGSVLDVNCWIALVPIPGEEESPSLALDSIDLDMRNLVMESYIISGSSSGLGIVPNVIQVLQDSGFIQILGSRLQILLSEVLQSQMATDMLENKVRDAKARCESSPSFDSAFNGETFEEIAQLQLSPLTIDTLAFCATVLVQAGAIVVLKNHLDFEGEMPALTPFVADGVGILDWTNVGSSIGLDTVAVDEAFRMGREFIEGTNENAEPKINTLLKTLVPDGVLSVDFDDLSATFGGLTLQMISLSLGGLDTIKSVQVMNPMDAHRISNSLSMGELSVKLELGLSTREGHRQNLTLSYAIKDIEAIAELRAVLNTTKLLDLQLGSFFWVNDILPCLLSTAESVGIENFNVTVGAIAVPNLTGLLNDTDASMNETLHDLYDLFMADVILSIPKLLNTTVKQIANNYVESLLDGSMCPKHTFDPASILDFRDFFLDTADALLNGASGEEPYGTLGPSLYSLMERVLFDVDGSGNLKFNDAVRSFAGNGTVSVSDKELLSLSNPAFGVGRSNILHGILTGKIHLSVSNADVSALDTVVPPLEILKPTQLAYILANQINIGQEKRPDLSARARLRIYVEGAGESPLALDDEITFHVSVGFVHLLADIAARLSTESVARLPIRDLLEPNCLLSLFVKNEISEATRSLSFNEVLLELSDFLFGATVGPGASPAVAVIPTSFEILGSSGAFSIVSERIEDLAMEFLRSNTLEDRLDNAITEGHSKCPSSPFFDPTFAVDLRPLHTLVFSETALDTLIYALVLGSQISIFGLLENHLHYEGPPQSVFVAPENTTGVHLLDWTKFGESLDLGKIADEAFQFGREYLSGTNDEGELNVNALIRDFSDNGAFIFLVDFPVNIAGSTLNILSLKIGGLTSFTNMDLLNPVGSQRLSNSLSLGELTIDVLVGLPNSDGGDKELSLSFGVTDIEFALDIYAAFNAVKLLDLRIGSLLHTNDILPCFLSTALSVGIENLHVAVGNLGAPQVSGLMNETDASVKLALTALHDHFAPDAASAIPILFNTTVKAIWNNALENYVSGQYCPESSAVVEEEFFEMSEILDGNAFGDTLHILRNFADTAFLFASNKAGFSSLNDLIKAVTKSQSGTEGLFNFPQLFASFVARKLHRIGIDSVMFELGNLTVSNVDTIEAPVVILKPNEENSSLLANHVRLGLYPSPLSILFNAIVQLSGEEKLSSLNDLEIGLDLVAPEIFATLRARVRARELLDFPLRELGNYNCWLALFGAPMLDDMGTRLPGEEAGLSIEHLTITLEAMRIMAFCRAGGNCTTSGIPFLEAIITEYEERGVAKLVTDHVLRVVDEIASSSFFQTFLDRLLAGVAARCLNHDSVDEDRKSFPIPSLPPLSSGALDSLILTAAYFFEMLVVVLFKSHESYSGVEVDPLLAQYQFNGSQVSRNLIDFSNLSQTIGGWADTALERIRTYVQGMVDDGYGGQDLGLNVILKAALLDESSLVVFDLSAYSLVQPSISLSLGDFKISGLDSVSTVLLLDALGPQTLSNELVLDHLTGSLEVTVKTQEAEMDGRIELAIDQVQLKAVIFAAIDKEVLGSLVLGQILDSDCILRCLLSSAQSVSFPVLNISIGDITSFRVAGFDDPSVALAVEKLTDVTLAGYKEIILQNMGHFFDHSVKAMLNSWIAYLLSQESTTFCPKVSRLLKASEVPSVDFRDLLLSPDESVGLGGTGNEQYGDVIRRLMEILNDNVFEIDPTTGLSSINSILISELTTAQSNVSGRLEFEGALLSFGKRIQVGGLDLRIDMRVDNAYIVNLDSFGEPFSILDPVLDKPSNLNHSASVGSGKPLIFGARLFLSLVGSGQEIVNDLDVALSLETVTLVLEALLRLSEDRFYTFPLRELLSPHCLISMIPAPSLDEYGIRIKGEERTAGLVDLLITVARMSLNVTCAGECSPWMPELEELLSTKEASDSSTETLADVLGYVTGLLGGSYLQATIDRNIHDAHRNCPSSPLYGSKQVSYGSFELTKQEGDIHFLVMLFISAGCITSALLVVMLTVKLFVQWRHRRWLKSLPRRELKNILDTQTQKDVQEAAMNAGSKPMFRSPEIPFWVRFSMPFIILGNVAFFLSGHLSLGGTVNIVASLGGSALQVDSFYEFSIMTSTIEIWNAGGTELAILILIFSVIWPYTKQLITLALWFLPPNRISMSRRGSFLLWLDSLAKWSMVDIMTLIVTVAAFRVSIKSPNVGFLPDGFYSVDLIVVPLWGLYANMIAQLISQFSSHIIIFYHRRIEAEANKQYGGRSLTFKSSATLSLEGEETDDSSRDNNSSETTNERTINENDKLYAHAFQRPHRTSSDKLLVRRLMNPVVVIGWVAITGLVFAGCLISSFSVEFLGFIGVAVESGQGFSDARTDHSIVTIVNLMREQAEFTGRTADKIGLGSLSALLVFSVLIVPLIQSAALVYIWLGAMIAGHRKNMLVVVETLQAWQYIEVYVLSVVVASWQLGPVSDFMINSYCKSLDDVFARLVYFGIIKEEDAQCFRVDARVENGSYVLASGAVSLALVNTFVMKAAIQYFRDLNERSGLQHSVALPVEESASDNGFDDESKAMSKLIRPVPVLFSDTFRWCLIREDAVVKTLSVNEVTEVCSEEQRWNEAVTSEDPNTESLIAAARAEAFVPGRGDNQPASEYFGEAPERYEDHSFKDQGWAAHTSETEPNTLQQRETSPDVEYENSRLKGGRVDVTDFEYIADTLLNMSGRKEGFDGGASVGCSTVSSRDPPGSEAWEAKKWTHR